MILKYKISLFFLLLVGSCLGQVGPTKRTALINLQRGNVVESSRAGQVGLTDSDGNQRYAQYVEIDLVPIGYTPTATGNTQNYSEFVTTASGDVWYIDWQGRGKLISTAGGGACDTDFLEIRDNSCPDATTDSLYKYGTISVGARYAWPLAGLLVSDSLQEAGAVISGQRGGSLALYNGITGKWSTFNLAGSNANLYIDSTGSFSVRYAASGTPLLPGSTTTLMKVNAVDSTLQLPAFDSSRLPDTAALNNIAYFGADGKFRKRPVEDLQIDSLNIVDGGVNLKDIESTTAMPGDVMKHNGYRWVPAYPGYGDVYKDSLTVRTKPEQEAQRTATVNSARIEWDADTTSNLNIVLTQHTALTLPENLRSGSRYTITVKQDAVGGWALSLPPTIQLSDQAGVYTAANATTMLDCRSDGNGLFCDISKYGMSMGFDLLSSYYDSLDIYLAPSAFGNMSKPRVLLNNAAGLQSVTSFGDNVYQYADPAKGWLINSAGAATDTVYPKTVQIAGRIGLQFDGVNDYLNIQSSRNYTRFQGSNFTLAFWIKVPTDGALYGLISNDISGGTSGWGIFRTAANKIRFNVQGAAGAAVVNYTTTASVTAAMGWVWVEVRRNGTTGSIKINDTEETLTFTTVAPATSTFDLAVGAYVGGGTANFKGQFGNIFFFNRYMSAATLSKFRYYMPIAPNLNSATFVVPGRGSFDPSDISGLSADFDFSDITTLYKDGAAATPVTTTGDNIRRINSKYTKVVPRYLLSPASGNDLNYTTSVQNGLGAATVQSGDVMNFASFTDLATSIGQKSIFAVFKSSDTLKGTLLSDNSAKRWGLSTVQTTNWYSPYTQLSYMVPVDSFRRNENYLFSSATRKLQWNVAELRCLNGKWYMSVNGTNFNTTSSPYYSHPMFSSITTSNTDNSLTGFLGEIIVYNHYLPNALSDKVIAYLGAKWGIATAAINNKPDNGRVTLVDNRSNPAIDYTAFPIAQIRQDTVWISIKTSSKHNDAYDAQQSSYLQAYTKAFVPIGSPIIAFQDVLGPGTKYDHSTASFGWLPDNRLIFTATKYDGLATVGGRDSVTSMFRIRELNGTMNAAVTITHPVLDEFFAVNERIVVTGGNWYTVGYGRALGNARYSVSIIKSTNSGSTWTQVARWYGASLSASDPEEPTLIQTSDGLWRLFYRDDVSLNIYTTSTTNIEDWDTSAGALRLVGRGIARPGVVEMSDKTLVLLTRYALPAFAESNKSVIYTSKDGATTWQGPIEIDTYREANAGYANMYGTPVDLGAGRCALIWGAENGNGQGGAGQIANVSYKIIKP